ncbi:MAG: hypothetical protein ACKO4T_13585, partial [Planctomycetaceae bacterium]
MRRMPVRVVGSSLIALLAVCPVVGRRAMANDGEPTVFQQGIRAWMGVVTLLAEDGDAASKEQSDAEAKSGDREHASREHTDRDYTTRGDRGGREGRGPREWSRDRGPGPRGPSSRMPMPPTHGMPGMPGMRGMPPMGAGSTARLDEIAERLARIERKLDAAPRMGNPWSPRPEAGSRPGAAGPGFGRGREMPPEMQERIKGMMEEGRKRMAESQEKMEQ